MMNRRDREVIIEVPYYETGRNTPQKRSYGTFILTLLLCAVMFFTGGGIFGIYLAGQRDAEIEASVRTEQSAAEPEITHIPDTPYEPPSQTKEEPVEERAEPGVDEESGETAFTSQVNPDGRELSLTELFSGANPAVVAISTETTGRNIFGQTVTTPAAGSGFVISGDGYVVTNNHVVEGADRIVVIMHNGVKYTATLVGNDPNTDVAVLKISAQGLSYLTFGDSDLAQVGEQVAAIGNPLGEFANSFTVGYISAMNRKIRVDGLTHEMIQTDTAVNSGNSGGPLLNTKGRVIGVVSAKSSGTDVEGLGFAIPSNTVSDIAAQLIDNGYISGRPGIGANLSTRSNYRNTYIYVESVVNGGASDRAGMKSGDYILAAQGKAVYAVSELRAVIAVMSPGDTLLLDVQRGNGRMILTLTLDEYKPASTSNKSSDAQSGGSYELLAA